jgi:hypothetical protein
MDGTLAVGLDSWIVQDGNYDDFKRGDEVAFALEFYALTEWKPVGPEKHPTLINQEGARYSALAQVAYVAPGWWVIDAGVLLFRDGAPPSGLHPGSWVAGEIDIGIDPFFYFESLSSDPKAPPLIYDWKIQKIEMQAAPLIEIVATDAWQDAGGHAQYLLHCERLPAPARRTR